MKFAKILPLILCSLGLSVPAYAGSMKVHHTQPATNISVEKGVSVYRFGPTAAQRQAQYARGQAAIHRAHQTAIEKARRTAQHKATQSAYKSGFADGYKQGKSESTHQHQRRRRSSNHGRRYSTSFALPRYRYGSFGRSVVSGRSYGRGY